MGEDSVYLSGELELGCSCKMSTESCSNKVSGEYGRKICSGVQMDFLRNSGSSWGKEEELEFKEKDAAALTA
jgi:hypothetical protein